MVLIRQFCVYLVWSCFVAKSSRPLKTSCNLCISTTFLLKRANINSFHLNRTNGWHYFSKWIFISITTLTFVWKISPKYRKLYWSFRNHITPFLSTYPYTPLTDKSYLLFILAENFLREQYSGVALGSWNLDMDYMQFVTIYFFLLIHEFSS